MSFSRRTRESASSPVTMARLGFWVVALTATICGRGKPTWPPVRDADMGKTDLRSRVHGRERRTSRRDRPQPVDKRKGACLKFVALAFTTLILTSCSKSFDALVFNPCGQAAQVSFGLATGIRWYSETTVPAESAVRVNGGMDASPGTVDQVRVVFGEASPAILKVRVGEDDPVPVLIPVAMCPKS